MPRLASIQRIVKRVARRPETLRFAGLAWLGAPLIEVMLRAAGLRQTLSWIEGATPPPHGRRRSALDIDEAGGLVERAFDLHPLLRGKCLERSLVQYALHRIDGTPARFVIGVARGDDNLDAHAWVSGPGSSDEQRHHTILQSEQAA